MDAQPSKVDAYDEHISALIRELGEKRVRMNGDYILMLTNKEY